MRLRQCDASKSQGRARAQQGCHAQYGKDQRRDAMHQAQRDAVGDLVAQVHGCSVQVVLRTS